MKFKTFYYLSEAPVFNDSNLELGTKGNSKERWEVMTQNYLNMKKSATTQIYKRGDLTFKILNGKDESTLYVGDDNEVKAYYVYYFEDVGDKEVPFLNLEIVKPSARGQGITTQVIDFILNRHGAIGSDYELTGKEGKGSYNSFEKLGNIYRCGVYSDDGTFTPTKDLSRKYMTSIASRFVVFNKKK